MANALAAVCAAAGAAMFLPALFSLFSGDGTTLSFGLPALVTVVLGAAVFVATRSPEGYVSGRDVFLIVVLGWLGVGAIGSVPFVLSGLMGPVDAFFESMAGFTTTGASTILTPEEVAPSLLLWRSLTQWAGGIGIVVIFVAVAPLVGFGATQLFSAEFASPMPERVTPRIRETAKVLAYVYVALTVGGLVALLLAGMGPFDAVNHAMTTVSTGGFSTRSDSIAAFDSWAIELAIVVGMLLSGVNFALYFRVAQGRPGHALGNREFLVYLGIVATSVVLLTAVLYASENAGSLLSVFREALFQTASLATGTAFSTAAWASWGPFAQIFLMMLMAIGPCAGSTGGGLKVIRAVLLVRHSTQEIFRIIHPQAVTPLKLGDRVIPERLRGAFLGFFFVYVAVLTLGTLIVALHGVPVGGAFGSVFGCLNITGTAISPAEDPAFFAELPASVKVLLTLFMLLGRLELFTVLVLLTPAFWRG